METIVLKPLLHRGAEHIVLHYKRDASLNNLVRSIKGMKWSRTHECWYLPVSKANINAIKEKLELLVKFDAGELNVYLRSRKKSLIVPKPVAGTGASTKKTSRAVEKTVGLSKENSEAMGRFLETLKLKSYSESTIKTYRNELSQLLQLLKNKPAADLSSDDLRRYFIYCHEKLQLSENTLHSRINAIKFYYEQVLGREKFFWEIPRPKKREQLPKVLSQDEMVKLIKGTANVKHRTMLMLAYSAGLRVSELVSLKTKDIDSGRMTIFIERAKGKKDRVVSLSPVLLVALREYAKMYKPNKKGYLFAGQKSDEPYSERSI